MACPVEHNHHQGLDIAIKALGDGVKVIVHRSVQVHAAFAGRAHDDFLHIKIRRVEQAALLAGGQDGDRTGRPVAQRFVPSSGSTAISTAGKLNPRTCCAAPMRSPIKSMGARRVRLHRSRWCRPWALRPWPCAWTHGGLIGCVGVAQTHRLRRFDCGLLDNAQKFQTQFDFHPLSRTSDFWIWRAV